MARSMGRTDGRLATRPAAVNRDDIINGAADLGVDLEEHIAFCIEAMKGIVAELGLAGVRKQTQMKAN
jgi:hypothetical protein